MVSEIKNVLQIYSFSKDEQEVNESILDMVDELCKKNVEPYAREMDQFGAHIDNGVVKVHPQMKTIVELLKKNDIFGLTIPEEYKGSGLSSTLSQGVGERISGADSSLGIYLGLQGTISNFLQKSGSPELKEKYLPQIATGDRYGGLLLTEPSSGSDLASVKTKAIREGDEYIVNGQKIFISNCHVADTLVFLGKAEKGLTAFVLDTKDQSGYQIVRLEDKMGIRASPTGVVSLENVTIPVENRIGEEGRGFAKVLNDLAASRIGVASGSTGIAYAAYRKALAYANERVQFGRSILKFQAIQFKIADMATKINIARNYYIYAAQRVDRGLEFSREASIAKLFASEMVQQVTYDAIQMHGGYGFIVDYDVERYYRDARIQTLFEGTSEIQRLIISREEISRHIQN